MASEKSAPHKKLTVDRSNEALVSNLKLLESDNDQIQLRRKP